MVRLYSTLAVVALCALVAFPAQAADPSVSKRVLTEDDGTSVIVVNVSASGRSVFGINISDASGSIEDIIAPKGWAGVASDEQIMFRTVDTPIKSGGTVAFRIVTKNSGASLSISFKDEKSSFGGKKTI